MIKRLVLALVLFLATSVAFADAPTKQYRWYGGTGYNPPATFVASANAACQWFNQYDTTGGWSAAIPTGATDYSCISNKSAWHSLDIRSVCATGATPNTALPLAQQCPAACPAGVINHGTVDYGVMGPTGWSKAQALPGVFNGCMVTATGVDKCYLLTTTGHTYCDYTMSNTGVQAGGTDGPVAGASVGGDDPTKATSSASPPVKQVKGIPCPAGSTEVGRDSDGSPTCVGGGTNPTTATSASSTTKPATTVTNADGSSVKSQDSLVTNKDGSVTTTTTTTTTGADGSVTVGVKSVTGNTPAGTAGKPGAAGANGTDGKDAKSLCDQHPELTSCKNSVSTVDCAAGSSYQGDAIEGATMQAVTAMKCKQDQDDKDYKASTQYSLGSAVASGADPIASTLPSPTNGDTVTVPTSLNTSGWIGAGSPFQDVTFAFRGNSITLPFAKWTGYLEALKYVMMVVASLISFKILSGAILKE